MKGKLRSESLPSAIYDAIVIHARRNENVSRKTHSSPLSPLSRSPSPSLSLSVSLSISFGFLNASPHQQLEETRTPV